MQKQPLRIYKIGGNVINNEAVLTSFLREFSQVKTPKILVHGGGKKASEISSAMGLDPKMINGRRVTDATTLEVVTMVYAGLLNKKIVAKLQSYDCDAFGLSGADGNSIEAHKRIVKDIDYGFVGDIDKMNPYVANVLIQNRITPVFCAITHNKRGQLLNTNADTIASEVAIGLSNLYSVELNYIFELKGVLENFEDKNSVIKEINPEKYSALIEQKTIEGGMLPKIDNCFNALLNGVEKVKIGDASLVNDENEIYTTLTL